MKNRKILSSIRRGINLAVLALAVPWVNVASSQEKQEGIQPFLDAEIQLGSRYTLNFCDNFSGNKLDDSIWNYRTDSKGQSTQKPENVTVSDGLLHLGLKHEPSGDMNFTGAGLISKQEFKYGYYEARFKVPPGAGWHSSFWLMKHDGSGSTSTKGVFLEIDICENDSKNQRSFQATVVRHNQGKKKEAIGHPPKDKKPPTDLSSDFYVYGCEYTEKEVRFFFNGKEIHKADITEQKHDSMNIWLTCISFPDEKNKNIVDVSKLPSSMDFDWVRYYAPVDQKRPEGTTD